jgi:3,4-dihydroxy 2-butanone 4-phosphate synthase / GTP cyclohydrolase II
VKTLHHFSSIPEAIKELKKGKMLIVVDDPDRENQADIIFPAATISEEKVNFLINKCRGMFCVPMTKERAARLNIPPMVPLNHNTEKMQCNFGITVDAKKVTSFGISTADKVLTVKTLTNDSSRPANFLKPGHVFPLLAADGGVLERNGHTEATIDLAKLAGFSPIGVLCEVLDNQGRVMQSDALFAFAKKHNLKIITISDLISYRKKN